MTAFVPVAAPVLHRPAALVRADQLGGQQLADVVAALWAAYDANPAVGVAAPQIGIPLAVAVVGVQAEFVGSLDPALKADREVEVVERRVLVNPSYVAFGDETRCFYEGCLSDPSTFGAVERPYRIRLRYADAEGNEETVSLSGWTARVVQHEVDHLMGVLFHDRAVPGSLRPMTEYADARLLSQAEVRERVGR